MLKTLIPIFGFTAWSFSLWLLAEFLGWVYRGVTWPKVPRSPQPKAADPARDGPRLSLTPADAVASAPPGSAAAEARDDAHRVNARVHWAHVGAWLLYAAVVSSVFVALTSPRFPWSTRVAIGYAVLAPQLVILLWAIQWPIRRRVALLFLYTAAGVAFLLTVQHDQPWRTIGFITIACVLIPLPSLFFLSIRRNQPFLFLLVAILGHYIGSGYLIDRLLFSVNDALPTLADKPWLLLAGLLNAVSGFVVTWVLLRQSRWLLLGISVVAGVAAGVLLHGDVSQHNLSAVMQFVCLVVLPIPQVFMLWSLFKGLVWLGERRFLTMELAQVHLCWINLTIYFAATTALPHPFYSDRVIMRWSVLLAQALLILTMHLLLLRLYRRQQPPGKAKRLLLLRVFGRPNEREDLLDDLNDTWLHIGPVDLLAASDVASRTLESRMLERFLLRRTGDEFLRTPAEVKKRIDLRRSMIQGDARYPVNPFFCHEDVWWEAVEGLAKSADVVLMDVRGFTTSNLGCVRELEHLLRKKPQQLVLLADSHSDTRALYEKVHAAGAEHEISVLDFGRRSNEQRRALFELLLKASCR